jgi:hypothetical protein
LKTISTLNKEQHMLMSFTQKATTQS